MFKLQDVEEIEIYCKSIINILWHMPVVFTISITSKNSVGTGVMVSPHSKAHTLEYPHYQLGSSSLHNLRK